MYYIKYTKGALNMQEVAQRLKNLRESVSLSQAKIAALMGATQASVNRYENGQTTPPLKILLWYADFFDVSMDYIFARTEQPEGRLYEHKPKVIEAITQDNKELRQFVDMCFDPASPVSEKLRDMLAKMLEEQSK
jgi:transcriptional regulator with XRE-family HTH domain